MSDLDDAAEPGAAHPAVQQGLHDLMVDESGRAEGQLAAQRMRALTGPDLVDGEGREPGRRDGAGIVVTAPINRPELPIRVAVGRSRNQELDG